jgi:hypothetical protein
MDQGCQNSSVHFTVFPSLVFVLAHSIRLSTTRRTKVLRKWGIVHCVRDEQLQTTAVDRLLNHHFWQDQGRSASGPSEDDVSDDPSRLV